MQLKIPTLTASQASVQHIDVGTLNVGPLAVGTLTIDNAHFAMNAAEATLRNLSVTIGFDLSAPWSIDLEVYSDSGTEHVADLEFTIPLPDLTLAPLNNIAVAIPTLTAQNVAVKASPIALSVDNAMANQMGADSTTLPTGGFSIAGLTLDSVEGSALAVPAAGLDSATINHLHADPIVVGQVGLLDLAVPNVQSAEITNTAPLHVPLALGPLPSIPLIDLGFLSVDLVITPKVTTNVGHLDIRTVTATASVGAITLQNVTVPFDVFNLTLAQVGINSVAIPTFTAS